MTPFSSLSPLYLCYVLLIGCALCAASGTYPSTCSEAGHRDGRLTLYWKQDPLKPWKAFCKDGNEYLALNAELNWSQHHKPPSASSTTTVESVTTATSSSGFESVDPASVVAAAHFAAVRIHPTTGLIDPTDHSFAQYTGQAAEASIVTSNGVDVEVEDSSAVPGLSAIASKLLWGSTGLCDETLTGSFEVSLNGTPFTFSKDIHWVTSNVERPALSALLLESRRAAAQGRIQDCVIGSLSSHQGARSEPILIYAGPQPVCGDGKIASGEEECDPPNGECCSPKCKLLPANTICRIPIGPCDAAEKCSGTSAFCPPDLKAVRGVTCRRAHHDCDTGAVCDGFNVTCPPRKPMPLRWPCRPAANSCDITEKCDGVSFECPADARQPDGHPCDDKNENTINDTCLNGQCVGTSVIAGDVDKEP